MKAITRVYIRETVTAWLHVYYILVIDQMAIRCEYIGPTCTHRYYVAVHNITLQFTDVHVEFRRCKLQA